MWFRNLQVYRLVDSWEMAPGALEQKLIRHPLLPCSGLSMNSRGWVSPRDNGQLVHGLERHMLIALGTEEKLLPAAVVKQEVQRRAQAFEQQKGFKPGRKQLRELKDNVTAELLPRAFSRQRAVRAWIDPAAGWFVVDTPTPGRADDLCSLLRETLGEFAVEPLDCDQSPEGLLTLWLDTRRPPAPFALDDECELTATDEDKATVRYVRHTLESPEIRQHIADGKRVTRLKLRWSDKLSFVLDHKLQIKRLSFDDVVAEREDATRDADEQFDQDFTLMTGELSAMLRDLTAVVA